MVFLPSSLSSKSFLHDQSTVPFQQQSQPRSQFQVAQTIEHEPQEFSPAPCVPGPSVVVNGSSAAQSQNHSEPPLSQSTSNDEIQELLVALLEEVCALKEAMVIDVNATDSVTKTLLENEEKVVEAANKINFAECF